MKMQHTQCEQAQRRSQKKKGLNMKYLLSAAAASALMAGTAFAGNIEPAPADPVIAPAPMPVYASPDWSGFYAGGQMGYADVTGKGKDDDFEPFKATVAVLIAVSPLASIRVSAVGVAAAVPPYA